MDYSPAASSRVRNDRKLKNIYRNILNNMSFTNQKGLSVVRLLVIVAIACVVIGGGFVLLNSEKVNSRDAKRLSDITRVQAAFELLYNETASYAGAANGGCDQVGQLVSKCNLSAYIPTIAQFKDPGKYSYKISQVPSDAGYEVTFYLEKQYGNLLAGKHTVSPLGIK
jgi:hypothetical protein